MKANLTLRYDKVGDILYIDKCLPYKEQDSQELDDEIGVRLNPTSGEIETVEINFFSQRVADNASLEIPVTARLQLPE
jgi:uncharacterized protein YuzE